MNIKHYSITTMKILLLLFIVLASASCNLYFKEHFFHSDEQFHDKNLLGSWNDISNKKETSSEFLIMDTRESGKKSYNIKFIHGYYKENSKEIKNKDEIPSIGKTYKFNNMNFLCLWFYDDKKNPEGKRNAVKNKFCNIVTYKIENGKLTMTAFDKNEFKRLKDIGQLEGFKKGGGRYSRKTFHITSNGETLRKVILSVGIKQLLKKKDKLTFEKREE